MRIALALDPRLAVLIAHGLFDLVTPYLATQLLLDQLPQAELGGRIRLSVYPGGHMFYTNDASRAALRDDAVAAVRRALISAGAIAAVCAARLSGMSGCSPVMTENFVVRARIDEATRTEAVAVLAPMDVGGRRRLWSCAASDLA